MNELPRRRSLRLRDYDYSELGTYFITIVTRDRWCLFGDVANGEMRLNDPGSVIERKWLDLPNQFPSVEMDSHIVMPNHIHGLLHLTDPEDCVGAPLVGARSGSTLHTPERLAPLGDIVGAYKSLSTNAYIEGVKTLGWPRFARRLWQRNYYEHIVRDEDSLERIREYILANPAMWSDDPENHNRGREEANHNRPQTKRREIWMV